MISKEFKEQYGLVGPEELDGFELLALKKFSQLLMVDIDQVVAVSSHNEEWASHIERLLTQGFCSVIVRQETEPFDGISATITVYSYNGNRVGWDGECGLFFLTSQIEEIINASV